MVTLIKQGAYLQDGRLVWADKPDPAARQKTIAYQMFSTHNKSQDPAKLRLKFDALISHDITFVGIIQTAKASGLKQFPIPTP